MFHTTLSYIMSWLVPNIRLDKFDVSHASLGHEEKNLRGSSHWLARLAWDDRLPQSLESQARKTPVCWPPVSLAHTTIKSWMSSPRNQAGRLSVLLY
jgi:hypothetical protein